MQNALKSKAWWWIWVHKTFKTEIHKGGPNNSDFLKNSHPPEVMSPLFNLYKFQDSEKITPESCRMRWNLMYDGEFWSIKIFKFKYIRWDQIIHPFCKIGSPQNSDKITPESCTLHWSLMNDYEFIAIKLLKYIYRGRDQRIQTFCRIG